MNYKLNATTLNEMQHISLPVNNIGQAVAWFQENCLSTVAFQNDSCALLECGCIRLALVVPGQSHFKPSTQKSSTHNPQSS